MFDKGAAPVLERAASFAEQRHRLIADNIANIETPGFIPLDLPEDEFHDVLARSLKARDEQPVRTFRLIGNRDIRDDGGLIVRPERSGSILRHGENKVDIDQEMSRLAENGLKFRTFSTLLKKQWTLLRDTISERP
ncbi:MAG: flagellar basal body rod protein FlgB [Planctomycetes bacterium]|nr:flagellar basal body rod protein FlgB [Planctomycetota bacterium]